jgi:hypothetical protein
MSREPYVEMPAENTGGHDPVPQMPPSEGPSGGGYCAPPAPSHGAEGDCGGVIGGVPGLLDLDIGALLKDTMGDGPIAAALELAVSGDLGTPSLGADLDATLGGLLKAGESDQGPLIGANVDLSSVGAGLCAPTDVTMPGQLLKVDAGTTDDGAGYDPLISVAVGSGVCGLSPVSVLADTATLLDELPVLDGLLGDCGVLS